MTAPEDRQRTIAVVGASNDRRKFGNKCVRAYVDEGWTVIPVHPHEESVEGLPCVPSVTALAAAPDRISVYLPPPVTRGLLADFAAANPGQVWFNPGSADRDVLAEARRLGIPAVDACSIVDIGRSPSQYR